LAFLCKGKLQAVIISFTSAHVESTTCVSRYIDFFWQTTNVFKAPCNNTTN